MELDDVLVAEGELGQAREGGDDVKFIEVKSRRSIGGVVNCFNVGLHCFLEDEETTTCKS